MGTGIAKCTAGLRVWNPGLTLFHRGTKFLFLFRQNVRLVSRPVNRQTRRRDVVSAAHSIHRKRTALSPPSLVPFLSSLTFPWLTLFVLGPTSTTVGNAPKTICFLCSFRGNDEDLTPTNCTTGILSGLFEYACSSLFLTLSVLSVYSVTM